jgi:transmembrane sensor
MPSRIEILFQQFIDGTCTQQEYHELMDLLRENQHEETVRHMLQQVYQSTARSLKSVTYVDNNGHLQRAETAVQEEASTGVVRTLRSRYRKMVMAAAVVLVLLTGAWLWSQRQPADTVATVPVAGAIHKITQRGELKYLLLPDSTQVWLNVDSKLEFPETFAEGTREVYLSGEAFFDVKHAANHPFLIHTGNVITKVLGTSFNIKAYPGQPDVVVSVKRGKVEVSKHDKVLATLTMGQEVKVIMKAQEATIGALKENSVATWTTGRLSYDSRPVSDILRDLERNYNVRIELTDSAAGEEIFTTSFRRDIGVEEALDIICKATDMELANENGKYIISRKQKQY